MTPSEKELLEALKQSNEALLHLVRQIDDEILKVRYIDFDVAELSEIRTQEIINKYEGL